MTDRVVAALQALVRIPTVSDRDPARVDTDAFDRLLAELETQFPLLHERLELTRVGTHGLLFRWAGASAERPVVLMAHLDVVPVDAEAPWQHDPFGGEIHDSPTGPRSGAAAPSTTRAASPRICEAVESLLEAGHTPAQDVWLSFGCDEEVSGTAAIEAVGVLRDRGRHAVAGARRGRRHRGRGVPGREGPAGRHRRHREGHHLARARRRGPRRPRLDAREERARPPASPARSCGSRRRRSRASAPAPTLELMRRLAPHVPLAPAPAARPRRPAGPGASPVRCSPPARRPPP